MKSESENVLKSRNRISCTRHDTLVGDWCIYVAVFSRAEGGYLGYLGLTGSNRRPSVIVDRILQVLAFKYHLIDQNYLQTFVDSAVDNDLQRKLDKEGQMSREAPGNHVATLSSIPARFQRKDPKRPRFDQRLVTQALDRAPKSRSLRQVAKKVAKQVFNEVDNEEDNQVENQKANLRLQNGLSRAAIEEKGLSTVKEEDCRITETNLTQKLEVSPQFEKIEEAQNTTETTHFPSEEMDVEEESQYITSLGGNSTHYLTVDSLNNASIAG